MTEPNPASDAARLMALKRWAGPVWTIECVECGKVVETRNAKRRFCGNLCVVRARRRQQRAGG